MFRASAPRSPTVASGSSSTSWRTSTSSSTSSPLVGLVRLVHPFPSALDGLVVAAAALAAGAEPLGAGRLALSMTCLQFAIGAANDLADAEADAGRPHKPIPNGLVGPGTATAVVVVAAGAGLLLAAPSGAPLVGLALAVLAIGLAYDLRLKGTPLAWLPWAVGIPLLPVYGWLGGSGVLPPVFLLLVPVAALEGALLALANGLADLEHDRAAGLDGAALRLGAGRTARLVLVGQVGVAVVAPASLLAAGAGPGWALAAGLAALVPIGGAAWAARRGGGDRSSAQRGWEVQAGGAAVLAALWLAGMAVAGAL